MAIFHCAENNVNIVRIMLPHTCHDQEALKGQKTQNEIKSCIIILIVIPTCISKHNYNIFPYFSKQKNKYSHYNFQSHAPIHKVVLIHNRHQNDDIKLSKRI